MRAAVPLRGVIQEYAWGSHTALAELLGAPAPSAAPQAELWLGAHPRGPAEALVDGRWTPLDALLARDPQALLGPAALARFGPRLPFLLKVLAVEQPLSIQAHPDAEQARAGAARGLFADPHAKPELVCALAPFAALCGFQPVAAIRRRLARLGLAALFPEVSAQSDAAALLGLFRAWLAQPVLPLARCIAAAGAGAGDDPACAWVAQLAETHPDDPGALAPLFLELIELAPGEAFFLPAGELHSHLRGVAVEVMGSSDNVLRGGLTAKPVDVAELAGIVRFASRRPALLCAWPRAPGEGVYPTPAAEFELSVLAPAAGAPVTSAGGASVQILLCTEGALRVVGEAGALPLGRGESCLVPAAAGAVRIEGRGRLYRAAVAS